MESRLKEELSTFMSRMGGEVHGVGLIRRDGLIISHIFPGGDPKLAAALTALSLGALRRTGEELKVGSLRHFVVYYDQRVVVVWPVKDVYIGVFAQPEVNLGLLMLELERLAKRLAEIL